MSTEMKQELKRSEARSKSAGVQATGELGRAATKTSDKPDRPKGRPLFHRPGVIFIGTLAVLAVIMFVAVLMVHMFTHESTDDAFIDGHIVSVAPKIAGKVEKVLVLDNQEVKKGDVLVEIDSRDADAAVAQKQAMLEVAQAKLKSAQASLEQARKHVQTIAVGVDSLKASAEATRVTTQLTHSDLQREQSLIKTGVVSAQDFEHSKSASASADANLVSKVKEVDATVAFEDEAQAQAESSAAQEKAAEADVNEAQAELAQAQLQASYTKITASEDGRVTTKAVEAGNYVQVGQALMALVPHEVWVTANYKETQITDMRAGQPAAVSVDAYPDRKLRAHVESIQAGSGARFSLLPPENATGNFVKVVQRVPVKIVFDEQMEVQRVLGPGMSAVPEVKVKETLGVALVVVVIAIIAGAAVIILAGIWMRKAGRG